MRRPIPSTCSNQNGNVVRSFGGGMFIWPHGLDVDTDGTFGLPTPSRRTGFPRATNAGIRSSSSARRQGVDDAWHAGEAGGGPGHFNSPSDIAIAENGDVLIADGHNENGNNRVVKFSKDGKYVKEWGKTGWAPGEFPHAARHRDRFARARIRWRSRRTTESRSSTQDGKSLAVWTSSAKPSGIVFDSQDRIYVADSESDDCAESRLGDGHPDRRCKEWMGDRRSSSIRGAIRGRPRATAPSFVAVDKDGNIYGGEPNPKRLQKYVRVRP
jgi:DNA-binding beta-propeller fold protein YncE